MKKSLAIAAALAAAVSLSSVAKAEFAKAEDGPALGSNLVYLTDEAIAKFKLTQDDCRNHAITTLNKAHGEELDPAKRSVFAFVRNKDDLYTVTIRCEMDNKVVFFAVAGKDKVGLEEVLAKIMKTWSGDDETPQTPPPAKSVKTTKHKGSDI
jgi:hypothetical protein